MSFCHSLLWFMQLVSSTTRYVDCVFGSYCFVANSNMIDYHDCLICEKYRLNWSKVRIFTDSLTRKSLFYFILYCYLFEIRNFNIILICFLKSQMFFKFNAAKRISTFIPILLKFQQPQKLQLYCYMSSFYYFVYPHR